jgi:hypothetical protein
LLRAALALGSFAGLVRLELDASTLCPIPRKAATEAADRPTAAARRIKVSREIVPSASAWTKASWAFVAMI